jgi:hypothetical protein
MIPAGIRPEVELLLCCARTQLNTKTTERIRSLLQQEIDWPYLGEVARQNGVVPLLYKSLRAICREAVPQAVLTELRNRFHANLVRNYFLTAELLKLLNLFETHHIPALPLKGPVLAASLYGDVSFREFVDLDILVRKQDVPAAQELVASRGYVPEQRLTRTQEAASLQVRPHHAFVRDQDRVRVELHWRLAQWQFAPLLAVDCLDDLWQRTGQLSLRGTMVRTLAPEDLLLFLCVHGAKHLWCSLGWVCDVAELIRAHPRLDWEKTMAQADRGGSQLRLLLGLHLARDLLGARLPECVQRRLETDPRIQALAQTVRAQLFLGRQNGFWDQFSFDLRSMERRRDRVRYGLRHILLFAWINRALDPPGDRLQPLYRLLEPVREKNPWLWPMPLFALFAWVHHPLPPIRRAINAVIHWGRGVFALQRPTLGR